MIIEGPNSPRWLERTEPYHRLLGPLQPVAPVLGAREALAGHYRGEPVWLLWFMGQQTSQMAVQLAVYTGERPIAMAVHSRHNTSVSGPTASSGDPAFDATYVVAASPPEVVSRALTEEVRRRITRRGGGGSAIGVENGFARASAEFYEEAWIGRRNRVPSFEEAAESVDDLHHLVSTLRHSFDTVRAEIAAREGEPAAAAWQARWAQVLADNAARSRRRLMVFVSIIAVIFLVGALAVILVVFGFVTLMNSFT